MGDVPRRRCLVTRRTGPRDELVRFVVSPDGELVPDLGERLPGRGLWLKADRDIVRRACAENVFSRTARRRVTVPTDLCDRLVGLLDERCMDLIGLARRSGDAVFGFERVSAAAKEGNVQLLLEASDGAYDGHEKVVRLAPQAVVVSLWTASRLGAPFGRDRVVHAAVRSGGLCDRLVREVRRLQGLRPPELQES